MAEDAKTIDTAAKKGRTVKAAEEAAPPTNTIIDLGAPLIVVKKADEPVVEVEAPISERTKLEMEMGRKAIGIAK